MSIVKLHSETYETLAMSDPSDDLAGKEVVSRNGKFVSLVIEEKLVMNFD